MKTLFVLWISLVLMGCKPAPIYKDALVYLKSVNMKTGNVIEEGWEETKILDEKAGMMKILCPDGEKIWVEVDERVKRL